MIIHPLEYNAGDAMAERKSREGKAKESAHKAAGRSSAYSIDVLNRTVDVLNVFDHARPSLGLKEIVKQTQLPKTTVFRILTTLVERDLCELDPGSGEYSLGFAMLRFADIRRRQTSIREVVMPFMREVRDEVNETIVLSVRSGDFRVHIDFVEGLQPMRRTVELGVRAPLYAGAASKVLLAGMEDDEIADYLERTPLTPIQNTTITDRDTLWQEVQRIRKRGYAESKGELIATGGAAVAAPLRDYTGKTVAVLDILTPQVRYTAEMRKQTIKLLLDATRRASERLGFREDLLAPSPIG